MDWYAESEALIRRNDEVIGSRHAHRMWVLPSALIPVSPETGKVQISTPVQNLKRIKLIWALRIVRNGISILKKKRMRDLFVWRGQSVLAGLLSQGAVGTSTDTWYAVASENADAPDMGDDSGNPDANEFNPLIGTPVVVGYEFEPLVKPTGGYQTQATLTVSGTVISDGSKTLRKIGIRDNVALPNRNIIVEDSVVPYDVILDDEIEIYYSIPLG